MVDNDHRSAFPDGPASDPPIAVSRYSNRPRMSPADEVGHALLSLTKASRSFTLYDPHNDAVKLLIGDYRDKSVALARNAPVEVDVLPFEMLYQNKVVYEERDRERSLAFRLFRDGVRKIRFESGIGWDDLVSLLEVMSVRCTGVRQQEEDLITLLRKARFENIIIESVEGYIPDEEMPENQALAPMVDETESFQPTPDWDQPLPGASGGTVQFQPIEPAALEALVEEESPESVAAQAVRSVYELLQTANTLRDRELLLQLVPFVEEVQQYLIVERNLDELARLAVIYRDAFGDGRKLPVLAEQRSFERIMRMVTEEDEDIPPAIYHLLGTPAGDVVSRALDMLVFGAKGARRKTLLEVVAHGASTDASIVVERIGTAPPDLMRELFGILGKFAPDRRIDAAFDLLEHDDPTFQLELLGVICAAKGIRLAKGLQTLMGSPHEEVRIKSVQALGKLGGAKAIPMLAEHARRRAGGNMSVIEAEGVGQSMAGSSVSDALPIFLEWAQASSGIRSLLSKIRKDGPGNRALSFAAVAGLALCPGRESEAALRGMLSRAADDPELADCCQRALDNRKEGPTHA